jgi:hypothetical protein
VDRYGIPVSLTYKNDPLIRSVMGGVATIIARLVIIVYVGFQCKSVFDKKYAVQTSMIKRDLSIDKTMYNLTLENFDFAVYMDYTMKHFEPDIYNNLDQYVDLRVTQNYYVWVKDSNGDPIVSRKKIRTDLVPCTAPRMLQKVDNVTKDFLGIQTKYLCPKTVDYYVQGMLSAEHAGFI